MARVVLIDKLFHCVLRCACTFSICMLMTAACLEGNTRIAAGQDKQDALTDIQARADSLWRQNRRDDATALSLKAMKELPLTEQNSRWIMQAISRMISGGASARVTVVPVLQQLADRIPRDQMGAPLMMRVAYALRRLGETSSALENYLLVATDFKCSEYNKVEAHRAVLEIQCSDLNETNAAVISCREWMKSAPGTWPHELGRAFLAEMMIRKTREYEKALDLLKDARPVQGTPLRQGHIVILRALCEIHCEQLPRADNMLSEYLRQADYRNDGNDVPKAWFLLAYVYKLQGETKKSQKEFEDLAHAYPQLSWAEDAKKAMAFLDAEGDVGAKGEKKR